MQDVFNILRSIEKNSSRNAKKEILFQNRDNEQLKLLLLYTFNARWIYGIGTKSIRKYKEIVAPQTQKVSNISQHVLFGVATEQMYCGHTSIFALLYELRKHPYGSSDDVKSVNSFLSQQTEEGYYWYTRVILKDLKIGCTAKTINEIYNDLIPVFNVMLAHSYKDHCDKIKGKFQIQQKLDGYRFVTFYHPDGSLQFFTRNGVELFDFPEIEFSFTQVHPQCVTMIYDGELIANDKFNDTQKLVLRKEPKTGLVYNVFDVTTIDEFQRGESFDKLFTRYDLLTGLIEQNRLNKCIVVVPELYRGDDIEQITHWFDQSKILGWEGIMVKLDAPYVRKRTDTMLKVKQMDTIDLVVLRVNEGTGKNAGRLGSVTVDFNGVEVDVGSGFNDQGREIFWKHPNSIIDMTIEIQYFEITTNEKGLPSLRFPVYKGIRLDLS